MTHNDSPTSVRLLDDRDAADQLAAEEVPWGPLFRSGPDVGLMTLATIGALVVAISTGTGHGPLVLVSWITLAIGGGVLAVVDARTMRLPFILTAPLVVTVAAIAVVAAVTSGDPVRDLGWTALGAGVAFAATFALAWSGKLGLGDVPLAVAITLSLGMVGPHAVLAALIVLPGLAAVALAPVYFAYRKLRGDLVAVPFGPFLIVGAVAAMAFQEPIARYLML